MLPDGAGHHWAYFGILKPQILRYGHLNFDSWENQENNPTRDWVSFGMNMDEWQFDCSRLLSWGFGAMAELPPEDDHGPEFSATCHQSLPMSHVTPRRGRDVPKMYLVTCGHYMQSLFPFSLTVRLLLTWFYSCNLRLTWGIMKTFQLQRRKTPASLNAASLGVSTPSFPAKPGLSI